MTDSKTQGWLHKAFEAFNGKLMVITPAFTILETNGKIVDRDEAEIVGAHCYHLLYDRSRPCPNCPAETVIDTAAPAVWDHRINSPEWQRISCIYAYPILADGKPEAIAILDVELPNSEQLAGKFERSNAFLRKLIQSAVDGVIAADMTGKVIIFNDAAAEVSGYTVEEALEKLYIQAIYPGDGAREVMRKLRSDEYGPKGKLKKYQADVLGKNGERIPISLYAAIIYENGREVATIGFFHDLRERIHMQKELEKTQIQLLQSAKMASLGKLAAGVAHQLNNPLGSITLYAKLVLEEYDLTTEATQDIQRILKDAQRCRDTVRELLEFARQTRQFMKPCDINEAIGRTLFLLENQTLFHNIAIERRFDEHLPEVTADIQQLNHMFMNLILNAAQAMEGKGRLIIETASGNDGNTVSICITDSGPGIPPEICNQIFEPFFTTKEEGKGTGLGLSIVYGIVENHRGRITAENHPEGGATFRIKLPVTRSPEHGDMDDSNTSGQ